MILFWISCLFGGVCIVITIVAVLDRIKHPYRNIASYSASSDDANLFPALYDNIASTSISNISGTMHHHHHHHHHSVDCGSSHHAGSVDCGGGFSGGHH